MVRNFDKRNCKFFHFTNVDPKGSACPHFNSKKADSEAAKTLRLLKHCTDEQLIASIDALLDFQE